MRGFTLVEALIALIISFLIIIGIAGLLTSFGLFTKDRALYTCLLEAASSGIEACRAGVSINSINCGGYTVNIRSIAGSCNPARGQCSDVTVTASYAGHSSTLTDTVCNWE